MVFLLHPVIVATGLEEVSRSVPALPRCKVDKSWSVAAPGMTVQVQVVSFFEAGMLLGVVRVRDVLIKGGTSVMGTGGSICIFSGESEFSTSGGLYVSSANAGQNGASGSVYLRTGTASSQKLRGNSAWHGNFDGRHLGHHFARGRRRLVRPVAPFQFQAATRPMLMAQGEISGLHLEVALERQGRYSSTPHNSNGNTGNMGFTTGTSVSGNSGCIALAVGSSCHGSSGNIELGAGGGEVGGGFFISAGTTMGGDACGGSIEIAGGDSSCGAGGPVTISAGSGLEHAGDINFYGGRSGDGGGGIYIAAGDSKAAVGGDCVLVSGAGTLSGSGSCPAMYSQWRRL